MLRARVFSLPALTTAVTVAVTVATLAPRPARADDLLLGALWAGARPQTSTDTTLPRYVRTMLGVGDDVTHAPDAPRGLLATFGASLEGQGYCTERGSCPFPWGTKAAPDTRVNGAEWAVHGRLGWQTNHFAIEGGAIARTESFDHVNRTVLVTPDVVARFGSRETFFAIGGGTYDPSTTQAPGVYAQGHFRTAPRCALIVTAGLHEIGPWGSHPFYRFDFAFLGRIGARGRIGGGLALQHAKDNGDPHLEARFLLGTEL
ncbi:MAG: hypothetical protein NVS3B10_23730 [Polyangiales bacterium]